MKRGRYRSSRYGVTRDPELRRFLIAWLKSGGLIVKDDKGESHCYVKRKYFPKKVLRSE